MSIQTASAGRVLLKFKGNWSDLGSYAPLDCTYHSGSTYVCKNNVSSSTTPDQDTTNWQILASGFDAAAVTALKNQITTGSSFAFVIGSTTYTDVESALGALKALYDVEIGTLSNLTTTDKSSLVSAINEVKSAADTASNKVGTLTNLTTTSKTDTVSAINEVKSAADSASTKVGTLSNLTTTAKTDAVSAINEVKGLADSAGSAASTASTKVGTLSNLTTTAKTDAVSAINEVDEKLSKTEDLISIVENGNTCTHTGGITKGQYVNWKGALYTADTNIAVGTTFASSGGSKNLTAVTDGGLNGLNNIFNSGTPEITSNERGVAYKFPSGLMICTKTVTDSVNFNQSWGSTYVGDLNVGDWAVNFIETPRISYANDGTYNAVVCGVSVNPTNIKAGTITLMRPDSTGTRTISISIIAIGRWK